MATRRQGRLKFSKTYGVLTRSQPNGSAQPHRPALATLHPNLRSTTFMVRLTRSNSDAPFDDLEPSPRKRKRASSPVARSDIKRRRNNSQQQALVCEDECAPTEPAEPAEDQENSADEDAEHDGPSDEFLLQSAAAWQLNRLRKEDLVRLHGLTHLTEDPESFNKSTLVNMLLEYRASQNSALSSASSSSSAVLDEDETPHLRRTRSLHRRATENYPPSPSSHRAITTRSTSLGNAAGRLLDARSETRRPPGLLTNILRPHEPSPRKTRARAKLLAVPTNRAKNQFPTPETSGGSDHPSFQSPHLIPRRLRQRNISGSSAISTEAPPSVTIARRRYPRKARYHGSLREDSTEDNEENEENEQSQEGASEDEPEEVQTSDASEDVESCSSESEAMDMDHHPSSSTHTKTGREQRRTWSTSRSNRSGTSNGARTTRKRSAGLICETRERATHSDEDGDDEDEDEEELVDPDPPAVHVLRNGKVVGEMADETEEDELESDGIELDELEDEDEDEEVELDEDDLDMSQQTRKTLLRHRRDDLVRLCEANGIEPDGTKKQLARALLEWRDSQNHFPSSSTAPSSSSGASTERPSSGRKVPRRNKASIPVLLRGGARVHVSPRPPTIVPESKKGKDKEEDIELDLGSLGLVDREIPPNEIVKLEKIGSGGFKDVYIGKYRNRKVAIAEFRDALNAMDIKELKLLHEFDHPNVVHFYGVSIPEDTRSSPVMIISELCPNGDLFDYIRNVPAPSLRRVLSLMLDIARGLEYLHLRNPSVIHRDCKSSNILITSKISAKITDFGLAKVKQSTRSMVRSLVGTVNWQAPELWSPHPKYDHKVDVFSCAMVYWEMLQWHNPKKTYPWEGMNEHAIYDVVGTKRQRPSVAGLRKQWCPEIVDLMERMWSQDSRDRPFITHVVQEIEKIMRTC